MRARFARNNPSEPPRRVYGGQHNSQAARQPTSPRAREWATTFCPPPPPPASAPQSALARPLDLRDQSTHRAVCSGAASVFRLPARTRRHCQMPARAPSALRAQPRIRPVGWPAPRKVGQVLKLRRHPPDRSRASLRQTRPVPDAIRRLRTFPRSLEHGRGRPFAARASDRRSRSASSRRHRQQPVTRRSPGRFEAAACAAASTVIWCTTSPTPSDWSRHRLPASTFSSARSAATPRRPLAGRGGQRSCTREVSTFEKQIWHDHFRNLRVIPDWRLQVPCRSRCDVHRCRFRG